MSENSMGPSLQFLETRDFHDLPFPFEKVRIFRIKESFLRPIITPPPQGGFVTILGCSKSGDSHMLT